MERAEAEAVYEQGRETVVAVLLELSAQNALLRREVADLRERVAQQEERIAELERRLTRNSRNSSLPPSQDPPAAPERRQAPPSGRGRGAQPGHSGHGRHLAPLESIDAVIEHWPARCACGHRFSETERRPVGTPARHQVAELPSIAVILSEHRLQRRRCRRCGAVTRAALPAGAFGPRLQAAVATLAVRNRVSRRDTTELLRELFGAQLSSGSVEAIVSRASAALEEPYEDLLGHVRGAPAVNIDETGWRLRGGKRTLWGALTGRAAVFRIAEGRHQREAKALLGEEFSGVACSDRWWAYDYLDAERRQLCWAHLVRDLTAHGEGLGAQKQFGAEALAVGGEVADQVRPAELTSLGVEVVVGPPAVRAGDAGELLAEQRLSLALVATLGDAEDGGAARERPPERALAAAQAPAGLVDVDGRRGAHVAEQVFVGLLQSGARAADDGLDGTARELGAEELAKELCGIAARDAIAYCEGGDGRLEARAEGARRHPGRQRGARHGAALRAAQALQAMLAEDDGDRRQLRDLMARRRADGATLRLAAAVAAGAARGPVLDHRVDRLERRQMTTVA